MSGISTINAINNIATNNNLLTGASNTGKVEKENNFGDLIKEALDKVNDKQVQSNQKIQDLIKGENVSMHDVMLSAQEAQLSMQLMIEVRNKIYEAYQELNRVQL